ncbi:MAG: 50S ribosomal protein L32e [Promethearchaeota archaeon]
MAEQKRLMELREKIKKKRPSFRRVESWRYKRVKGSWRKARGIDSQTRKKTKTGVRSPTVGYRGPKKVRGLHASRYVEVRVNNVNEIKNLKKTKHAVKISSKLGAKKRLALIDFCQKRGFKILNLGISQKEIESLESLVKSPISELKDEDLIDVDELEDAFDMED